MKGKPPELKQSTNPQVGGSNPSGRALIHAGGGPLPAPYFGIAGPWAIYIRPPVSNACMSQLRTETAAARQVFS